MIWSTPCVIDSSIQQKNDFYFVKVIPEKSISRKNFYQNFYVKSLEDTWILETAGASRSSGLKFVTENVQGWFMNHQQIS